MDQTEYLASLRLRLDDAPTDPEAIPRHADAELLTYLADSVKTYSRNFPRERIQQFTADGTANRYDVPDDLVDNVVHQVSYVNSQDLDVTVPRYLVRNRSNRWFEVEAEQIVFGWVPTAGTVFRVLYDALHVIPASETDDWTVPSEDEELIFMYAMYLAFRRVAGNSANLDRWKEEGKRDDNPLIPQYVFYKRDYDKEVAARLSRPRTIRLVRAPGMRDRRVR